MGVGKWTEGHWARHEFLLEHIRCYWNLNVIR